MPALPPQEHWRPEETHSPKVPFVLHVWVPVNPHSLQLRFEVEVSAHSVQSPSQSRRVPEQFDPSVIVHACGGPHPPPGHPVTGQALGVSGCLGALTRLCGGLPCANASSKRTGVTKRSMRSPPR